MGLPLNKQNFVSPEINLNDKVNITHEELVVLIDIIKKETGIKITEAKTPMVESRLSKRLRKNNLESYSEYIDLIRHNKNEYEKFINAMTTNKTDFFREPDHFDFMINEILVKEWTKSKEKNFRVWSAAGSTGEEAYTISICLNEYFSQDISSNYKILATDVDTNVLKAAEKAVYKREVVAPVRPDLLHKYFHKGTGNNSGYYKVSKELKKNIKIRKYNLIEGDLPTNIMFDVIFLRNVLIYFEPKTIQKVIDNISRYLKSGGYLFIGHSETLNSIKHNLKTLKSSIYKKV